MFIDDLCPTEIIPDVLFQFLLSYCKLEILQRLWKRIYVFPEFRRRSDFADSKFRSLGFYTPNKRNRILKLLP